MRHDDPLRGSLRAPLADPAPDADPGPAPDAARWLAEAFEGGDAALIFDDRGRLVATNARLARTFGLPPPAPGTTVAQAMARIAGAPAVGDPAAAPRLAAAVLGFHPRFEIALADGRTLDGAADPTPNGGHLVTFRDGRRDRLREIGAAELLARVFDGAGTGVLLWDAGRRIRVANAAWTWLFGAAQPGDGLRDHVRRAIDDGAARIPDGMGLDAFVDDLLARMQAGPQRIEGRLRDGRRIEIATYPGEDGGVLATATDVSARRDAEQALRHRLEEIVESLPVGIALYDRDLRLILSNTAAHRLADGDAPPFEPGMHLAETAALAVARGALDLPPGTTADAFAADLVARVRAYTQGTILTLASGRTIELSVSPTPIDGYLATLRDVTEERRAADAERAAEARVRSIVDSIGEGIALYDAGLRLVLHNPAFAALMGPEVRLPPPGTPLRAVVEAATGSGAFALSPGVTPAMAAARFEAEVRADTLDRDLAMADGRVIEATSHRAADGGHVVLMRDVTARRSAEGEARMLLRDAVEALEEGLLLYDETLRAVLWNDAYARIAFPPGRPPAVGEHAHDHARLFLETGWWALPPGAADVEAGVAMLDAAIETRAKGVRVTRGDGRIIEGSVSSTGLGGVLISARDITEAQAAEERARVLLRDAVDALGEGMVLFDRDRRMVLWNDAFVRLIMPEGRTPTPGLRLEDLVAMIFDERAFVVPEGMGREAFATMLIGAVEGFAKDFAVERTDGLRIEGSAYPTPLGGYLASTRDVTQRVRAEEQAREADELVRTIVDASPTSFLVSRFRDGKVIYQPGPSVREIGRIDSTEGIFVDPATRAELRAVLAAEGRVTDFPVRLWQPDGGIMEGRTSARVVEFRGERLVVASTRDVTDQLRLEAELDRQREAAHQNEKMSALGELLAGVAHELNNPLSVVVGYVMMLQESVDDPKVARRLREVSTAADRCARIVRTFLAMARQRPTEVSPLRIDEIVRVAVEVAGHGLRASGGEIVLDLAPDLPRVMADGDQIAQVFANLVVNAEHAMAGRDPARLTISATRSGDAVAIRFADTGSGIDPALRSRIFDPFFTTKDVGTGTGVGLAFSHRIVTSHGGRLSVDSEPGRGATFTVTLPVARGRAAAGAAGVATGPAPPAPRGRVLVVEDDAAVSALVRAVLTDAGHAVTIAATGSAALDACGAGRFDAVLCDVRMPGMDGTEVFAALRERGSHCAARFAFLTGDALSPGIAGRIAATGRPCLEKPVTPAALLRLVAQLMET